MEITNLRFGFGYNMAPESPTFSDDESEGIKLKISRVTYSIPRVDFYFHLSFRIPGKIAIHYRYIREALNFIVHDAAQEGCGVIRTNINFISHPGPNYRVDLPPLPPNSIANFGDWGTGGWVNGNLAISTILPKQSPSIFVYAVLETYISNVVGIDLTTSKAVEF
jgi:hypothetical protein